MSTTAPIHIATFHIHVEKNKKQEAQIATAQTELPEYLDKNSVRDMLFKHHGTESEKLISMLFRSARAHYPDCFLDVLTDTSTQFPGLSNEVLIHRNEFTEPFKVMRNRLFAQVNYLKSLTDDGNVVMVDSDILINGRIPELNNSEQYGIVLTVRNNKSVPINGGVYLISGTRRHEAISYLERAAEIYDTQFEKWAITGGGQPALREAVFEITGGTIPSEGDIEGGIRFIPTDMYNFTPSKGHYYRSMTHKRKEYILHFKGPVRFLMHHYFVAFIIPNIRGFVFIDTCIARAVLFFHALRESISSLRQKIRLRMRSL